METLTLLQKYFDPSSLAYTILVKHSYSVTQKAIAIAESHPEWNPDISFIKEAAMLHDIGIFLTNAPAIGCFGKHQYIEHGYLGSNILKAEGLPRHALVCERHTGMGLSIQEIVEKNLPLPHRNMIPLTLEEQIICYADKFFSKSQNNKEFSIDEVRISLTKYGPQVIQQFDKWTSLFLGIEVGKLVSKSETK
ncbi:HD domain-containing protein [Microbacter margulisiae]|uniref:HD domain-containing protein n=1 Tax=Microbacter margulisiae TaxID=1350067 RepID=A0A7W5DR64_9PORP|nr:HD domain-containing protein [Microbacter margulisiae]MBB3187582.1 uncharacterized protein [Microbacter margulisiae]